MANLDSYTQDLSEEVRRSEEWRDRHIKELSDMVGRYHGVAWDNDKIWDHDPENPVFETISMYVPILAYTNPKIFVDTLQTGPAAMEAKAVSHATNRWVNETKFSRLADKLAVDFLMLYGVTLLSREPRAGLYEGEDPIWWPQLNRLSQRIVAWDYSARSWEERRFTFHMMSRHKERLIEIAREDAKKPEAERDGWRLKDIQAATSGYGAEKFYGQDNTNRGKNEIFWYEIYFPNEKVDQANTDEMGFHGKICTYAYDGGGGLGQEIREPRDYYGPRGGPYTLYGCYTVPDSSMPLSPLLATVQQQKDLGRILRANNRATEDYKRIIAADDENFVQAIKDEPHDHVFFHPTLSEDNVQKHEFGGVTDQSIAQEMRLRDALERVLGISDAMRGNVTGDATATENQIAASGAATRQGFIQKRFIESCEEAMRGVAWFIRNDDEVQIPLNPEDSREYGTEEATVVGGRPDGMALEMEDLELSIEIDSMGHKTPEQRRAKSAELLGVLSQLGELGQLGFVDIDGVAESIAKEIGFPKLPQLVNGEVARMIVAAQLQAEQLPPSGKPAQPQPKLSKTIDPGARQMASEKTNVAGAANSRLNASKESGE